MLRHGAKPLGHCLDARRIQHQTIKHRVRQPLIAPIDEIQFIGFDNFRLRRDYGIRRRHQGRGFLRGGRIGQTGSSRFRAPPQILHHLLNFTHRLVLLLDSHIVAVHQRGAGRIP